MKIKFIKDYEAVGVGMFDGTKYAEVKSQTFHKGAVIGVNEAFRELVQWLIDNGFAEEVEENQWINDATIDVSTNKVQLEFTDDMGAIDFQSFIRAVKVVSNDAGFMTRGSDRVGWAICLKDDGQLGTTVASYGLAGAFCFEWSSDAEASIKNHPDEWKTIAKYKWGK